MDYDITTLNKFKRKPKLDNTNSISKGLKKNNPKFKQTLNLVAKISNNGKYRYINDIVYVSNSIEKYIVIDRFISKVHFNVDYRNDFVNVISCNGRICARNR